MLARACTRRQHFTHFKKSFHELSFRLYNLHWCILLKRTPRISFFGGHKARKQLPLLSTFWKTPAAAAASGTAHASPLNLIVVVQSDSCDRHMNSKFARAMASCSRFHLLEVKVSLKWYVSTSKKGKEKHSSSDLCYQDASSFGSALSRCSIFWQVVQAGSANLAS